MNEAQRSTLALCRRKLADDIIVDDDFLAKLVEKGIFDFNMINIIKSDKEANHVYKMLDLLPKRGPLAFDRFVEVLKNNYEWLADLLEKFIRENLKKESFSNKENNTNHLDNTNVSGDEDIKTLVGTFVHQKFGQSKRISEKDKKAIEKFVTDQVQKERSRYQALLSYSTRATSGSTSLSDEDDTFRRHIEIQNHLSMIHKKIKPHLKAEEVASLDNDSIMSMSTEQGEPEELSVDIIHGEIDQLISILQRLQSDIDQSKQQFRPEEQSTPLPVLVRELRASLRNKREQAKEWKTQFSSQLDKLQKDSEYIEKLERERQEYRAQINVLSQDMGKLKQEKKALHEEMKELQEQVKHLQHFYKDQRVNWPVKRTLAGGSETPRDSQLKPSTRTSQALQIGSITPSFKKNATDIRRTTKK